MRVTGVETEKGTIKCQYFVNAAGIWAHEIGRMSEPPVKIPIWPAERFFMTFKNIEELEGKSLPNVRDYDSQVYIRQNGSSFMMGAFESQARPYDVKRHGKDLHYNKITDAHLQHMEPYITAARNRLPILQENKGELFNTPDAFTPDGKWILGETPEVGKYFVSSNSTHYVRPFVTPVLNCLKISSRLRSVSSL